MVLSFAVGRSTRFPAKGTTSTAYWIDGALNHVPLGYLLAFSLFVVAVLLAMGVCAPMRVAAITVCTMVVVHVVFIEILNQPLPRGLLDALAQ